jgi:hypothetical protein
MFGEIYKLARNIIHMKQPEYTEGPKALQNFKGLATAILQAPSRKKKQTKKSASLRKPKKSDKD